MDDWDYGQDGDSLWTTALATCHGVAIVGDCGEEGEICEDRWLAHVAADNMGTVEEIAKQAKEAVDNGLTNVRVEAVFMDPDAEDDDYKEAAEEINQEVIDKILEELDVDIEPIYHDANEAWQLTINSDKSFSSGPDPDSESDADEMMEDWYDEMED